MIKINVFVDNFIHPNSQRAAEIATCIETNKENKLINYHLMNSHSRMTYQNFFDCINNITSNNNINVISNIDIVFDETINLISTIDKNQFAAITRREIDNNGVIFWDETQAKYSQDIWAWVGKCKILEANFCLGRYRCDNIIATAAIRAGYDVINPSFSIMAYHIHRSNIRADDYFTNTVPGEQTFVFPMTLNVEDSYEGQIL